VTRQDFDGYDAVEPSVAGAIDLSHTAGPDGRLDLVRSEPAPRNEWHEFGGLYLGASNLLAWAAESVPSRKHLLIVKVGMTRTNWGCRDKPLSAYRKHLIPKLIFLMQTSPDFGMTWPPLRHNIQETKSLQTLCFGL
jgi:hypothetical protein